MFNVDCYSKIIIFSLKWKKKALRETHREGQKYIKS